MSMTWYPGTRVRLSILTYDETATPAVLADPTTLTVRWGLGSKQASSKSWPADIEVVKDSTGTFHIDIDCPAPGFWGWTVTATGALVGADAGTFKITSNPI